MLKLVSFHIQAHLNAFRQILEYFSQICLGPLAIESPCRKQQKLNINLENCAFRWFVLYNYIITHGAKKHEILF